VKKYPAGKSGEKRKGRPYQLQNIPLKSEFEWFKTDIFKNGYTRIPPVYIRTKWTGKPSTWMDDPGRSVRSLCRTQCSYVRARVYGSCTTAHTMCARALYARHKHSTYDETRADLLYRATSRKANIVLGVCTVTYGTTNIVHN